MPEQFRVGVTADFNTKAAGLIDAVSMRGSIPCR